MDIHQKVKVSNPEQINYPLEGVVIASDNDWGVPMSQVKFILAEVWYADCDLEIVPDSHPTAT